LREDYRISPGDVIDILVDRAVELSGSYPVTAAGTFKMQYLGQVTARDKTREELVNLITDGLSVRYLKNPRVTVVIKRLPPRRNTLFIQGSVRSPGVYQLEGRPSLLKLITNAGGLEKDHGSTAYIFREIESAGGSPKLSGQIPALTSTPSSSDSEPISENEARYELHTVNIGALLKGDLSLDSAIKPDDIINIPPTDMFFVTGEVKKPGSFPLREGTTFTQAISLAEGKTFSASDSATILRVDPKTGTRLRVSVNIGALTKGKKEDLLIQADDIISVSNSKLKSAASVILRGLGGSVRLPYQY
jgi:polysaccharide export outer membrane protein